MDFRSSLYRSLLLCNCVTFKARPEIAAFNSQSRLRILCCDLHVPRLSLSMESLHCCTEIHLLSQESGGANHNVPTPQPSLQGRPGDSCVKKLQPWASLSHEKVGAQSAQQYASTQLPLIFCSEDPGLVHRLCTHAMIEMTNALWENIATVTDNIRPSRVTRGIRREIQKCPFQFVDLALPTV